jgi:hypothetical protein
MSRLKLLAIPLLLMGAVAMVAAMVPPDDVPAGIRKVGEMTGRCRAEINGRSVQCEPYASSFQLVNERTILAFTLDKTVYWFSGCTWTSRAPDSWTLDVDVVSIFPEQGPERRLEDVGGDCVVQTSGGLAGTFTAIDCAARPPGGERYRVRFDEVWRFQAKGRR